MQPNLPFILRIEGGPEDGQQFPLVGLRVTIGRQAGNAIVIDDERLSRRHAQISLVPGGLTVTDLGSANGTRVNGQSVAGTAPLRPGDLLDLGGVTLRVEGGASLPATAAVAPPAHYQPAPGYAIPPAVAAPQGKASSSRLLLIVGGVLAVLLLCGCGGFASVLVLANRGGDSAASSGGSGGSGGGAAGGGTGSSTKPESQYVKGTVLDARGKGVENALIQLIGTTIRGEYTEISVNTDKSGKYSRRVPDGLYKIGGYAITTYNGKKYTLTLDPDDGDPAKNYDSKDGIVKDFHWKLTGLRPDSSGDEAYHYYGAYLSPSEIYGDEAVSKRFPGGTVEIILTPRGPLVDGSTGQVVTRELPVEGLGSGNYPKDIPIGAYTATARVIMANGKQQPLQISPSRTQFASSINVDFTPGTVSGVDFFILYVK